jgi:hypothetical protein
LKAIEAIGPEQSKSLASIDVRVLDVSNPFARLLIIEEEV